MKELEETIPIVHRQGHGSLTLLMYDALELLKEKPEIVRCKDCTHGVKSPTFRHYPNLTWCNQHSTTHNDEWFCADGERKSEEEKLMEEMDADPLG